MSKQHSISARSSADKVVHLLVGALAFACMALLAFVMFYITAEALPLFEQVGLDEFLFGERWMPIDYSGAPSYGIFNMIAATLMVSLLALAFSLIIGLGAAIFLSCVASERTRSLIYPVIDLLAGIPSIVYGFIGIIVLTKLFLNAGVSTGSCVLAAAILLSVMLLPFVVSSCSESLLKKKGAYLPAAESLGVERWYAITNLILPASWKSIITSLVLAIGRAMGETMAVMMVIGNANLFPELLGKGETIAGLIALEMGTAEVGSTHYHALFAAGLLLLIVLLVINAGIGVLRSMIEKEG